MFESPLARYSANISKPTACLDISVATLIDVLAVSLDVVDNMLCKPPESPAAVHVCVCSKRLMPTGSVLDC